VDGLPVRACLMLAGQADDTSIVTVEGLAKGEGLSDVQQAFIDHHGLQCGFCTPGFLTLLTWLFDQDPAVDDEELREVLGANLCRCTGYQGIMEAALQVRRQRGEATDSRETA
jgi:carbon-monoxide dehydrogenase small subunit